MPRALRLESKIASNHVINRCNYRAPVLAAAATKRAFLRCLHEAGPKIRWLRHAWALMSNHYHLAVTTPQANLAAGMHWLQCTFAMRFNRWGTDILILKPSGDPLPASFSLFIMPRLLFFSDLRFSRYNYLDFMGT